MSSPVERVAEHLRDLKDRQRGLSERLEAAEFSNSATAPRPAFSPGSPLVTTPGSFQVGVTAVDVENRLFEAARLTTTDGYEMIADETLSVITGFLGVSDPIPQPGDIVCVQHVATVLTESSIGDIDPNSLGAIYRLCPQYTAQQQFQIVSVFDDLLLCNRFRDGVADTAQITVAKPWMLRRTPFDGITYQGVQYSYTGTDARTATQGEETEDQEIVPAYASGDILCAQPVAGLGLSHGGASVDFQDVNETGRAWAQLPE